MTKEQRRQHNIEVLFDCNLRELTKEEERQLFFRALSDNIENNNSIVMNVNHTTKTITATNSELPMVANYIEHLIAPGDRKSWKVSIVDGLENKIEYRSKKT